VKIAMIGATGFVGSHILEEALSRGHEVTAMVRHPEKVASRPGLEVVPGDVFDPDRLATLLAGHDAVVSAYSPPLSDPCMRQNLLTGAEAIIRAARAAGIERLLMVGGAGSLELAPGRQVVDQPDFPVAWKAGSLGMRDILERLRRETVLDWTFLSPAERLQDGARTGTFRLGGDQLLRDASGECRISVQDYAVAMIDELEHPEHSRRRFCVAY
jgi:uncharacterized protein